MSYGLQIRNSDGSIAISDLSRPPKLIYYEEFDYNFSGTRSVPDFDDTKGFISVSFGYHKIAAGGAQVAASTPISSSVRPDLDSCSLPSIFWSNSAKTLTLTATSSGNTDYLVPGVSEYAIYMVHYK